ncbi:hypothetical protein Q1695_007207 [Nippostrongylus brasiliensis]|nr:hypothetical protein Q1695_007207 [Nippostrongylus brasiliensis]
MFVIDFKPLMYFAKFCPPEPTLKKELLCKGRTTETALYDIYGTATEGSSNYSPVHRSRVMIYGIIFL